MSNVRVCAKVRPQNEFEDREGSTVCVSNNATEIFLQRDVENIFNKEEKFSFDRVFGQDTCQQDVFGDVGVPLVETVLNGINCTLFAYGQSGAGKTFTMEGNWHISVLCKKAFLSLAVEV